MKIQKNAENVYYVVIGIQISMKPLVYNINNVINTICLPVNSVFF